MPEASREDDSPHVQQLRAALHYAIGRICDDVAAERGTPFRRTVVATLTEAALSQAAVMARDLELFAQHARRAAVCADDVKLLVRRSPTLSAELQREARRLAAHAKVAKERRRAQRGRRGARGAGRGASAAADPRTATDDGEVMELE
ncbi:Centromere protein S [Amphibalanus amphitrite]|uniref:Centromere protein S n=1 Tax=Amphibalanus amphitrite TaxID=1232801 RepID=A0A6A4XAK4_AMPAM|nr:centromere protein S-like [Amphibalanus amphitrite]XP_043194395.1 centromere protein S-like [Amphibalanus amphitrite]XP_043194396.1 centromere protein S-like [Amphibalanus amphitrite]XP_043194397.1 centromere protein S-like [Amphibalanus amphitrite]XP_043194398.1 centromere protein S-like [Amphibalanus amphitrite]XP_043194399.1 centromere protein S-like [Amphibalanus amphitrite]XP_043194400.1 centromere protein S-like [Amphibalanus amphitrite]KAF0295271.1 Centromere protein S [Amphibalanu